MRSTLRAPRRVHWRGLITGAALALTAWSGPVAAHAASTINVEHGWFRFLLPSIPAGGYMTLHNPTSHPVTLTAAHSPACGMTMLHKTVQSNGQDKMVMVMNVMIPAHGSFSFHPGAYHVMCMQPKMKPGETVPVTLEFDHAAPVTAQFRVYGAKGRPASQ